MTLLRHIFITFMSNIGMTLLGLLTGVLLARTLGPTGRGLMTTVLIWPTMLVWAGGLSFGYGNIYYGAAEPESRKRLFANSVYVSLVLGTAVGVAAAFILPHFLRLTLPQHLLLTVSLCTLSVGIWSDYAVSILQSARLFKHLAIVRTASPFVVAVGLLSLWLIHALTVTTAIIVTWLGSWVQTSLVLQILYRHGWIGFQMDQRLLFRSLSYGSRIHIGTLAGLANGRLDQLLMTALVTPKALGIYAFSVTLSELLKQVSLAVSTVLFPQLSEAESEGKRHIMAARATRWTMLVSTASAVLLYFACPLIIHLLWGDRFAAAVPVVRVLLPGTVALCLSNTMGVGLYGDGKALVGTWAEIACLLVMAPLLWLLLPRMGIFGAGLASTCGYLVHFIVVSIYFAHVFGRKALWAIRPTRGDWRDFQDATVRLRHRLRPIMVKPQ